MTGRSDESDLVHALEKGASDYIVKPFEANQLHARLRLGERIVALQEQVGQMQKLESMGRLASGVAHEINTPVQFVGDNVHCILETFEELGPLLKTIASNFGEEAPDSITSEVHANIKEAVAKADLEYVMKEIPSAVNQGLEGVGRITKIVASMKDFGTSDE